MGPYPEVPAHALTANWPLIWAAIWTAAAAACFALSAASFSFLAAAAFSSRCCFSTFAYKGGG